ncbi:thiamine phosphate synthase [Clostridium sp. AM58-1XD]|uniref:thiamine phosphate synthase n=1 Tax=Clostridium sp. AM58-1XD TaxID=2292307 RepID=UPI000E4D14FB|nr:thiamine phosphate synthase [Clostridium sp. AM58-1XD]RGZ00083.1 thiamine phosphate synthase [Clostridium sp. AM58-1XD]
MTAEKCTQVIAVTNRKLCTRPFLEQIKRAAEQKPHAMILREKDLTEGEYEELAEKVMEICKNQGVDCILHTYMDAARRLGCRKIHLPLWLFEQKKSENLQFANEYGFEAIGVSTHSLKDAVLAEELGASYITAGHIFVTDCKKGLEPRGLDFLKEVCEGVNIPVYAIGGIHPYNQEAPIRAGAAGVCMMSEFMKL